MPFGAKEKKLLNILIALFGVTIIVLVIIFREELLPTPRGGIELPPVKPRLNIQPKLPDDIFKREDFSTLQQFGDVPVKSAKPGVSNPFEELAK